MAKSAKKVLISGYIGFNNFGDEAIFCALVNHLKEKGYAISALSKSDNYDLKTYYYKNPFEILKAIFNCNILISGGGSLLQNKTSNFSLIYYLSIIFLAKLFFKKVIIFAQGIEPIKGTFFELITKTILKTVDFITVRDQKSVDYLNSLKIQSTLVSDPVYSLVQDKPFNENKKGLVVQLRNFNNLSKDFLITLAGAVAKYNKEQEVSICSFQDEIDKEVCLDFIVELKKNNIEAKYISNKPINETIEILNNAKYVISMRLHALIVAAALKTKAFALKYDDKIETLSQELSIPVVDVFNYQNNELDNKLNAFFNHHLNEVHPYRRFNWECIDSNLEK